MAKAITGVLVLFSLVVAGMAVDPPTPAPPKSMPAPPKSTPSCDPANLNERMYPCLEAIMTTALPTKECCTAYRGIRPCVCTYIHDHPELKQYLNDPVVKKMLGACNVELASC